MNHTPFWRGLLRTVLTLALSLFLLSLLVFVIAHYAPGDPLRAYFGDRVEKMSVDERAWAEAKLGLDRPVLTQYGIWLQNALHGDFGISYKYKMDVLEVIRTRLPYTLRLGGVGFVLLFVLSLGVGVLCARHEDSLLDRILCRVGTVMSCVPEFWLSLVLILLFAVELRWLPSSGAYSVGGDGGFADRARASHPAGDGRGAGPSLVLCLSGAQPIDRRAARGLYPAGQGKGTAEANGAPAARAAQRPALVSFDHGDLRAAHPRRDVHR